METVQLVKNSELLVEAMGHWPSFHDANVLEASRDADSFSIKAHVFAMTDEVDPAGYYVLEKHHLVSFTFRGVRTNSLPTDYSGDCLDRLIFGRSGDMIQVDFESHMGQDGTVVCAEATVTHVVPYSGASGNRA